MNVVGVTNTPSDRSAPAGSRARTRAGIRRLPALAAGALLLGAALVGASATDAAIVPTTTVLLPSTGTTTDGLPGMAALFLVAGLGFLVIARRSPARER